MFEAAAHLFPDLGAWAACATSVLCGTVLQRLSGAGFGMIAAPMFAIFAPEFLPGAILLLGLVIGLGALIGGHDAVVRSDLTPGLAGRVVGAIIAASVARLIVGTEMLPIVVALIVLLSVGFTVAGLSVPITGRTLFGAGTIGGVMGTLTGIGAPPMAILYSTVDARRSAATQNAFFGLGMIVSIGALAIAGQIRSEQIAFAASLAPVAVLALRASRPLARRFERGAIRPWALGLATLSALVLLARTLS